MEISDRMYKILGLLLVMTGFVLQIWRSIFQTEPLTIANEVLFPISLFLLFPGSVMLATASADRLFAKYHWPNCAIALTGLVGMIMLIVFRGQLESLLSFPNTLIVYFLIIDFFWIFMLGLIIGRFKTTTNEGKSTN
jgi:hypothetical protein